jgi:hypothetical protein
MTPHPHNDAPDAQWIAWLDLNFPFDPREERRLRFRQERERMAVAGTDAELEDLRGLADPVMFCKDPTIRTRDIAVTLAKLWFSMREKQAEWRRKQSRMPTRQLEQERDDLDAAIGAAPAGKPYRQAEQRGFDGEWTR